MREKKLNANKGFTIVELMIALTILSTLLVISTMVLMQISRIYTKGVNMANLQNATRTVSADVTSALEFSGASPANCIANDAAALTTCYTTKTNSGGTTVYTYCIGSTRYSYIIDRELGEDAITHTVTNHVLWRDTMATSTGCPFIDITAPGTPGGSGSDGYEMAPTHTRLNRFYVNQNPADSGIYEVQIWMAYGDNDLMTPADSQGNTNCYGTSGSQFCATSKSSTVVTRRLD
jgi:prepilin-type N-terminal cleavage/methylation domain-containing protein